MVTQSFKISKKILERVRKRVGKTGGTNQGFIESATTAALDGAAYTEADIVSFGKFLYSKEREKLKKRDMKENGMGRTLLMVLREITASDLLNWKEQNATKK